MNLMMFLFQKNFIFLIEAVLGSVPSYHLVKKLQTVEQFSVHKIII